MPLVANVRDIADSWTLRDFSAAQKRNMAIYILGIMLYKFGLEAFNGSVVALATNRYDYDALVSNTPSKTFQRLGLLTGLNQAFQCVGSILIAPLMKRFPTKNVLALAILTFAVLSAVLLIMDAATGGTFIPDGFRASHPPNDFSYYGRFNTDGMIPVYAICGIGYGMVELIRRVIPRDIVGGNVQRLRKMDAIVHVFYEISGTAGAFTTALVLIPQFGNNRAFLITPICFGLAALVWVFITHLDFTPHTTAPTDEKLSAGETTPTPTSQRPPQLRYLTSLLHGVTLFFQSLWLGFRILVSSRRFIWLIPGYAVALYAHRYLENGIAPQIARRYLGNSAWSQIMVGGSNLGELLGAAAVFLLNRRVPTPIPWLRLDAVLLLVLWYLPYWTPPKGDVGQAWIVAGSFVPISFGWAAGDVSLAAYIQAALTRVESKKDEISALGAVMAFLYSFYVVTYAILGPLLGSFMDGWYNSTGGADGGTISEGLVFTAGYQFTVVFLVVFGATFIPRGSSAFNPKMLFNESLVGDVEDQGRSRRLGTSSESGRSMEEELDAHK